MADAIKEQTFSAGETIIVEGEEGNLFYIIIEGSAIATKVLNHGEHAKEVMNYKPG
jgi:CRP-like cAMP-binding protein